MDFGEAETRPDAVRRGWTPGVASGFGQETPRVSFRHRFEKEPDFQRGRGDEGDGSAGDCRETLSP